ncbi:MAG: TIGR01777 family oxidoreductase [Aeromonas sp.]
MHILITGASGFIGRALLAALSPAHTITVLTRQGAAANLGDGIATVRDLSELSDLNHIDAVINLAGESIASGRWSAARKQILCQSRWHITEQLTALLAASHTPPSVLISASAVGWYGAQSAPVDETCTTPAAGFTHNLCAHWEALALSAASAQTRVCVMRLGLVLGHGGILGKMAPAYRLGLGAPVGSGEQMMSWVHLHDVVQAVRYVLEHPHCQAIFNLTAPAPVSNRAFSQVLAAALRRPHWDIAPLSQLSAPLLRCALGEAASLLLEGQAALPARLQAAGFSFTYPTLAPALAAIFPPRA